MRISWLAWILGASALACGACAAKEDDGAAANPYGGLGDGGGGFMAGAQTYDAGGTTISNSPVTIPDAGSAITFLDSGGFNAEKCAMTKAMAPPPSSPKVDIVWVVDSSQSMFGEQALIKANLAQFADSITKASIDVSIVMVSRTPTLIPADIPFLNDLIPLCPATPADPLAGTALAMDPRYHFVETTVDSHDLLTVAVDNYAQYGKFLRPGSTVHFITVTDDEARYKNAPTAQARATQFQTDMMQTLGRPFQLHTIASPAGQQCSSPNCTFDPNQGACVFADLTCSAQAGGDTYEAIAKSTNGQIASICAPDWTPIFKMFQESIIKSAPLPCDYTIPPPPSGEKLDREKVNVTYTAPGAAEEKVFNVPLAGACAAADKPAWHYDVAAPATPTKVVLCPAVCAKAAAGGTMTVVYGCKTEIIVLN